MKLREYIKEKEQVALNNHLEKEAVKKLLMETHYQDMTDLVINYNSEINEEELDIVLNEYLVKKRPIQYILGYTYFYGLKLKVNENVLIPRFDTELSVEMAIKVIKEKNYKKIIDIGTGSGAIAISIANYFTNTLINNDISIYASDISSKALEVAKENAKGMNITFLESDMFNNITNIKFDLIISNPPYISFDDVDSIDEIVYRNEPHLSLFAKENGLYYYKEIIKNIDKFLDKEGTCIFEIGYNQGPMLTDFINNEYSFLDIKIYKDYNNLDRMAVINYRKEIIGDRK